MKYFVLSFISNSFYYNICILKGSLFEVKFEKNANYYIEIIFKNMKLINIIKQSITNN